MCFCCCNCPLLPIHILQGRAGLVQSDEKTLGKFWLTSAMQNFSLNLVRELLSSVKVPLVLRKFIQLLENHKISSPLFTAHCIEAPALQRAARIAWVFRWNNAIKVDKIHWIKKCVWAYSSPKEEKNWARKEREWIKISWNSPRPNNWKKSWYTRESTATFTGSISRFRAVVREKSLVGKFVFHSRARRRRKNSEQ